MPEDAYARQADVSGDIFRKCVRIARIALSLFALVFATANIFGVTFGGRAILATAYFYLEMGVLMALGFLTMPATRNRKTGWYDVVLALATLVPAFYVFIHAQDVENFAWMYSPPQVGFILAVIFCLVSLEAARRAGGPFFLILIAVFLVYPVVSGSLPSFLWSPSTSFHDIIAFQFFGSGGIFGMMAQVLCYILLAYILFASAISVFGGGQFFIDIALTAMGKVRGGAAKVSVLSSALMASISGSSVANVITTGSFTIPTMKGTGYSPDEAGAIESCASAGGPVMPPVMGAAGFVMAQILNIRYAEVCLAAFIPSVLFFAILFFGVDLIAVKKGLKGLAKENMPHFWPVFSKGWYYLLAIFILVFFLFFARQELSGAFYASAMLLVIAMIPKALKRNYRGMLASIIDLAEDAGKTMAYLTCLLGPLGILLGALFFTGSGTTLSIIIERVAGGNLLLLLLLAASVSFVMGCGGMSITGGYVILAILIGPAIVKAGHIYPLSAHLFILFTAVWSVITPPVATNVFAAVAISGGSVMKTSLEAMRLGFPLFVLPFQLVYNSELSFSGSVEAMILALVMCFLSLVFVSVGFWGFFYKVGNLGVVSRAILIISGLAMIPQTPMLRYSGLILAVIVLANGWFAVRNRRQATYVKPG